MTYDLIGTIYTPTGVILTDAEGNEYPEMTAVQGYHVNALDLTQEELAIVQPFVIQVNTPGRVFAGRNDTVYLKFADRAEWLSLGFEVEDTVS